MKKVIFVFLSCILMLGCKKSSSKAVNSGGGTASYGAYGYSNGWNVPYIANNTIEAPGNSTDCIYYTNAKTYEFYLTQQSPTTTYGLTFAIPGGSFPNFTIPVNQQFNFNLNSATSDNVVSLFSISFSSTESVGQPDSVSLSLTITRLSNNTMDGKFAFQLFYGTLEGGYVNNGLFQDMPYKTD